MPTFGTPEDRDPDRLVADRRLVRPREPRHDLVEQIARAVAVERGERDRVAEPESVELDGVEVAARVVDLVREHGDGLSRGAQDRRELLVAGRDPGPRVDDEEHEVGLVHRRARLLRDVPPVRPGVGLVHAAGVDEPEGDAVPVAEELLAVARHPRGLVDDRGAGLRQPVDERRLADVREADDRDRSGDPDACGLDVARRARASAVFQVARRRRDTRGTAQSVHLDEPVPEPPDLGLHQHRRLLVALAALRKAVEGHRLAPARSRRAGSRRAATPASRGSRRGRSGRPPAAPPSPRPPVPGPGRRSAGACLRRRARAPARPRRPDASPARPRDPTRRDGRGSSRTRGSARRAPARGAPRSSPCSRGRAGSRRRGRVGRAS